jgi:hypothetical protein
MRFIDSSVYSFILTEEEWYAGTDQQREAWIATIMHDAKALNHRYASILVEPSAVLSISPVARRHKVWGHSFANPLVEAFHKELSEVYDKYRALGLTRADMGEQ